MNKYIFGKGLRVVLALLLAFAFSMQIYAAGGKDEETVSGYCRYVNPFSDFIEDYGVDFLDADFSTAPVYKVSTRDELLEAIRSALANRITVFTVNSSTYYELQSVFDEIYNHTDNPKYGDYLRWNSAKIDCNVKGTRTNANYHITSTFHSNAEQEKAVDAKLSEVMASLDLESKDEYGRIKAIYDYICSHVVYDFDNLNDTSYTLKHSTYAALIDEKAVCQGYATLFYRMCMEAGIDARVITGYAGEPHAWNIVKLGKYYYNIDSTWDAVEYRYRWFLRGKGTFDGHNRDAEYTVAKFTSEYPIAGNTYVEGQGDLSYKTIDNGKTLVIYGAGAMAELVDEAHEWYAVASAATKIIIEEGITSISEGAFSACSALETVEIADSVKSIGGGAFAYCTQLKDVTLGSNLTNIKEKAFWGCKALKIITIPEGVQQIGESAFDSVSGLAIRGYKGTLAEEYAKAEGFEFVPIFDIDLDGSGEFGESDMVIILDFIKGTFECADDQLKAADVNGDGSVDIRDYNLMFYALQFE